MSKNLYFAAFAAAFAIVGCSEKSADLEGNGNVGEKVQLTVNLPGIQTKVTGEPADGTVNDVQIFVFDRHGVFETSQSASASSVSLTCTTGEKQIVALVNAEPEASVGNINELRSRTSDLKDSSPESLVMAGEKTVTLTTSGSVEMPVTRLASRIRLVDVRPEFELPQHQQLSFEVKAVYLINVAGDKAYLSAQAPSLWYNMSGYDASTSPDFLYDEVVDGTVASGSGYDVVHTFYCYPNATDVDTRLVVEAEVGGNVYYYPVTLDSVEQNRSYSCSLKITRLGSDDPDTPVEDGTVKFTVKVEDWVETELEETI